MLDHRSILETLPVLVWLDEPDGRRWCNSTWLRFTGMTLERAQGDGWLAAVHPDDVDRCRPPRGTTTPIELEYRLRRHDGVYRTVLDIAFARGDGFLGAGIDVQRHRDDDAARASFLASVVHELRSPLQALETYLSLVQKRHERGEALRPEDLARASAQLRRFTTLLADLADLTGLERGRGLHMAADRVDLLAVVESVVGMQREILAARDRQEGPRALHLSIVGRRFAVRGDGARLGQVLFNLIDNAIKYSPDGGEVRIELVEDGTTYRVRVSDRGVGIPAEDLPRIRDRFFRSASTAAAVPGDGLGLAIVHEIVTAHRGRLDITSELGQGTTVIVTLPADGSDADGGPAERVSADR